MNQNHEIFVENIFEMTAEEIRDYCLAKAGATESFPFDSETLVFKVGGKMFLLVPLEKQPSQFAAKADPEWTAELREQFPQITGAYHMNKIHWNMVICEGLKVELLHRLIDHSYELVFRSLTKKLQKEILP